MEDFLKKIDQELKINLTNVFQEIRKMQRTMQKQENIMQNQVEIVVMKNVKVKNRIDWMVVEGEQLINSCVGR